MTAAHVYEVFSGIQGEGPFVGRRHLFVRFAGCNLACRYCDTPEARRPVPVARLEVATGARRFEEIANPVDVEALAGWIARLDRARRHDAVSLTGGEPLLAADFLAELIPRCAGRRFHLETNGTLPDELAKVIDRVDVIAMDIKLPSATGQPADADVSRAFLRLASRRTVFVKVVVTDTTGPDAVADAAGIVASVDRRIPLVIQPVTPVTPAGPVGPAGPDIRPPGPRDLLELQWRARAVLDAVLVIPQVHKLMGQK